MAASTETPRTRVPRAEQQAQMLEVAEHVFSARGWQAATMDEIADLVGVTKPLIYDYFGSKEGLLAATIERAFTLLRTEGAVIGVETSSSVEGIRQQTAKAFAEGMRTTPQFAAVPAIRLAVWRAEQHGMKPEVAAEMINSTLWDGLASVGAAS